MKRPAPASGLKPWLAQLPQKYRVNHYSEVFITLSLVRVAQYLPVISGGRLGESFETSAHLGRELLWLIQERGHQAAASSSHCSSKGQCGQFFGAGMGEEERPVLKAWLTDRSSVPSIVALLAP